MARTVKDPIPVGPFLEWCRSREAQIRRELDRCPAIQARVGEASPTSWAPRARLVMELGWPIETGQRRLWRWEFENQSGMVARAAIEDALEHAGADFSRVYPDLPVGCLGPTRLGNGRRMTDAQVVAAHTVYVRRQLTFRSLADLIWERFGYTTSAACAKSLVVAFRGLGLPVRQCIGLTRHGTVCRRAPSEGSSFCSEHGALSVRPSQRGGGSTGRLMTASAFVPGPDLLEQARVLYVDHGVPMTMVGWRLVGQTPLTSGDWLAQRLAVVAASEGWYQPRRRPERQSVPA